jgi:hypothetical protein
MDITLWKLLLASGCWYKYSRCLVKNKTNDEDYKIGLNIVSATHAYISVPILGLTLYNIISNQWIIYWSAVFYFNDIGNLLVNKWNIVNFGYLIHHIIAIYSFYSLYINILRYNILIVLFLGELSNFPLYIVYHLKKRRPNSLSYKIWLYIEIVHYSLIRVFGLGYYLYKLIIRYDYDSIIIICSYIMYSMGFYWSIKLWLSAPFLHKIKL